MTVNFSDIYRTCNKLFLHSAKGTPFPATHYVTQFFDQAEEIKDKKTGKPMYTTAKMALQQAYVDTLEILAEDYKEGEIEFEDFQNRNNNVSAMAIEMQNSEIMRELDSKIKQQHKSTGAKRLAILPNIMDSNINGLGMVRHSAGLEKTDTLLYKIASYIVVKLNPAVISLEEEIVENKGMKKLLYFMHKCSLR